MYVRQVYPDCSLGSVWDPLKDVKEGGGEEVNEMEDSITYGIEFHRAGLASWVLTDHRYVTAEIAAKSWDYEIREGYARIVQITTTHTIVPWIVR